MELDAEEEKNILTKWDQMNRGRQQDQRQNDLGPFGPVARLGPSIRPCYTFHR